MTESPKQRKAKTGVNFCKSLAWDNAFFTNEGDGVITGTSEADGEKQDPVHHRMTPSMLVHPGPPRRKRQHQGQGRQVLDVMLVQRVSGPHGHAKRRRIFSTLCGK
jgi:hypothetical protein